MSYQFLPWVKSGTGAAVAVPETLTEALPARVGLPVTLRLNDRHDAPLNIRLFGPGDITGIDPRQIVRVEPRPLTPDFEPNYFPAVEFRNPAFPWMFTPATGDARGRLRPWLCLVVVRVQEGVRLKSRANQPLPVLTIAAPAQPAVELPDLADSWGWAHTQVIGQEQVAALEELLRNETTRAISRLLCPVKLTPSTRYYACLVPAFEAGRTAGLGLDPGPQDGKLIPAWRSGPKAPAAIDVPVYFHWEFATGGGGDFESLVRRLRGRPVPAGIGVRDMEVAGLGFGLPDLGKIPFEGALRSPNSSPLPDPQKLTQFQQALRGILNAAAPLEGGPEPVVGPPLYARYQAAVEQAPAPGTAPRWLGDLNLDPRYRATAGLGTLVVQDRQEQLMASAWEQLAGVKAAMQALRQAALAREVGRKVLVKHLTSLSDPQLLQFTTPIHARIQFTSETRTGLAARASASAVLSTLDAQLQQSHLPGGLTTGAFRKIFRTGGPITRRVTASLPAEPAVPMTPRLVELLTGTPTRIVPMFLIRGFVTTAQTKAQVDGLFARVAGTRPAPVEGQRFLDAVQPLQSYLERTVPAPSGTRPAPPDLGQVKRVLLARLDPDETVTLRLRSRLSFPATASSAPAGVSFAQAAPVPGDVPVLPHPVFPQPMYEALRDISQEFLLPGVEKVPSETVTLVKTNAQFVESFMVGLNHEMSRELLWREYPTDQRGTYFTRFWDIGGGAAAPQPQIAPIHLWNASTPLGRSFMGDDFEGRLVLLIRGEVLRRYPGTVIYATRADTLGKPNPEELYPVFRGTLEPDIVFLGFDLTEDRARGGGGQPGYYFILQEQPAEPRFGLDIPGTFGADPLALTSWDDVTWGHLAADAAAFDRLTHAPLGGRLNQRRIENVEWGFNGAHMARIVLQKRVRVAMHASELLPPRP